MNHLRESFLQQEKKVKKKKFFPKIFFYLSILLFFLGSFFYYLTLPTGQNNNDVVVQVKKGDNANILAQKLKNKGLIKSEIVFKIVLKLKGVAGKIHVGKYNVTPDDTIFDIVKKIENNEIIDESIKFTIFPGWPNYKIAESLDKIMKKNNIEFSKEEFLEKAKDKEGFLYPDTYSIDKESNIDQIIDQFYQNYKNKTRKYILNFKEYLENINKTEKEAIIMASIVEAEAGNVSMKEKRMVAGILWHRLEIGMPLQADAVFSYIKQKPIPKVLNEDLKVESEYNVYKKKGLPPGPIGNPALSSIRAALTPEESNYLYYLTDKKLKFHYAITYQKHLENQKKYITNAE